MYAEAEQNAPRSRGRPRGTTDRGAKMQRHLYETAIELVGQRGWQETTLREIAREAGVSVGLLYKYFPSKQAVLLALYDELSADFENGTTLPPGRWRNRFSVALKSSLGVLEPYRRTLAALLPVLVGSSSDSLFAPETAFSRIRVQRVFAQAILGGSDAPNGQRALALGRLGYLLHLAVLMWWLLDRSPSQRATQTLVGLIDRTLPLVATALLVPGVSGLVDNVDQLVRDALFDDPLDEAVARSD